MPKAKFKPMTITLEFTEADVNAILKAAYIGDFGDGECPLTARKLTPAQYRELHKELKSTAPLFVVEIVELTRDGELLDGLRDFAEDHVTADDEGEDESDDEGEDESDDE